MNLIAKVTSSGPHKPLGGRSSGAAGHRRLGGQTGSPGPACDRGSGGAPRPAWATRSSSWRKSRRHLTTFATARRLGGTTRPRAWRRTCGAGRARPDIAELREIGRSLEERPIVRCGSGSGGGSRPSCSSWVATTRANGSPSRCPTCSRSTSSSGHEPAVAGWLARERSGWRRWSTRTATSTAGSTHRLWRKNRRPNPDGTFGVDPNRNYGYMWGTLNIKTSSHVPSDETYVGPRAFSEPETRAVRDLIARELFGGVITYHSYSQLILYPWGYTDEPSPTARPRSDGGARRRRCRALIEAVHGKVYIPQQSSELYPTAGDTTDWTYGIYGIPSFTVELRPAHGRGGRVHPPARPDPADLGGEPSGCLPVHRTTASAAPVDIGAEQSTTVPKFSECSGRVRRTASSHPLVGYPSGRRFQAASDRRGGVGFAVRHGPAQPQHGPGDR